MLVEKVNIALQSFFVVHSQHTNVRLILWTTSSILVRKYFPAFYPYMEVREWDPVKESKGTPLELRMTEDNLRKNDERNYFGSDLLRLIVLYKYLFL